MAFLDKTGLAHLWNHIVARLNGKADLTDISTNINTHNSSTTAHNDIRTTLSEVKEDVDTFFKDANLSAAAKDTLKEIQDYITSDVSAAAQMTASINSNKEALDSIAEGYLGDFYGDALPTTGTTGQFFFKKVNK